MKRIIAAVLIGISLSGCNALKGPKGDKGDSNHLQTYAGPVTSDTQTIFLPSFSTASGINVYVGNGLNFIQVPLYAAGINVNMYFVASSGSITLYNAKSGNPTIASPVYNIVVIN